MLHITLTGVYSGHPICGCKKDRETDEFIHVLCVTENTLQLENLCTACKEFYVASAEEVAELIQA